MLKIHAGLTGAMVASAFAVFASAAVAEDMPKVAVDLTTLTSPFWTSYNKYIVDEAKAQGIDLLEPFNSEFDTAKQITGVTERDHPRRQGHHLLAVRSRRPPRPCSTRPPLPRLPIVAVDVAPTPARSRSSCAPTTSPMARRPANTSASTSPRVRSCRSWATRRRSTDATAAPASATASPRTIPKLKLLEIPTKAWSGEDAAAGLDAILNSTPDLKAIYMHAGGVFLAPTLQTLKRQRHAASGRRGRSHHHRQQ